MPDKEKIVELVDRLSRISHGLQFAEGLNPAQWEALRFISRANRMSCSPGALASYMASTKGTVSQTLKALEAKGLIERARDPGDRRNVRLSLTARGAALLDRDPLCVIHDSLAFHTDDDQASLLDCIERLLLEVQRRQGIPEFGPCLECVHYRPEECNETNTVGCRCAVSGELFRSLELDRICNDFSRRPRPTGAV